MRWLYLFTVLLLVACTPIIVEELPVQQVEQSIQRAIEYLKAEYHRAAFGLLPESPEARPNKHWLATDNQLAVYALRAAKQEPFASQLETAIQRWGATRHGIIEALAGETIAWPPHPEQQFVVGPNLSQRTEEQQNVCSEPENSPENVICHETRAEQMPAFSDWQAYADLALYGALNACHQGDRDQAYDRFRQAMRLFDGVGFHDKAYDGSKVRLYTTYKLALALYVGAILGETREDELLTALLSQQNAAGGFITLYDSQGVGKGDSNTETTAYALLALATLQRERSSRIHDSICPRN